MSSPHLINLGCGTVWHPAWRNFDLAPLDPSITPLDLSRPVPLADAFADAIYHSHVFEHLPPADGARFLADCFRVLKQGGIVRVVVPNLESLAEHYLAALRGADDLEYDWSVIALLDQLVRERREGAMGEFLRQRPWREHPALRDRMSTDIGGVRTAPARVFRRPDRVKRKLTKLQFLFARLWLGPREKSMLDEAQFRAEGEIHRWMYDRRSLARALARCGFRDPVSRTAVESGIAGFAGYALDTDEAGRPRHPESLYMEATKP